MLSTRNLQFDPAFLVRATGGTAVGSPAGDRVVTDSRDDVDGALFVALSGPNFDGHDFVDAARSLGAAGVVVSTAWWEAKGQGSNALVVPDPLLALQALAAAHRNRFDLPVGAVTGSNGKTTTKELLAAALEVLGPVLATRGNRNNHIGLPLTLLDLTPSHKAAVVEIGLNHPGELKVLSPLARPRVGLITNVAEAHLQGLGSIDGVARAKAEVASGIEPGGCLVIPADCPPLEAALKNVAVRTVTFGLRGDADLVPTRVESRGWDGWNVELPQGIRLSLGLPGTHAVTNALAALAAAREMGVPLAPAAAGMARVTPVPGRLCPRRAADWIVLDDTYNANPGSVAAALEALRTHPAAIRVAILGDMLELGPHEMDLHRQAGEGAAFLDRLITVGTRARGFGDGAVAGGLDPARWEEAGSGVEAADRLLAELGPHAVILVKGSRGVRLETAVDRLLAEKNDR